MFREQFIEFVLTHHDMEGGDRLVRDPADPGGLTRWGISQRAYPNLNIEGLTLEQAIAIAVKDYWQKCRCDELPKALAAVVFDMAFNSGTDPAIRTLQKTLRVTVDGKIGPQTLAAAQTANDGAMLTFLVNRARYLAKLKTFPVHGGGWSVRLLTLQNFILSA